MTEAAGYFSGSEMVGRCFFVVNDVDDVDDPWDSTRELNTRSMFFLDDYMYMK